MKKTLLVMGGDRRMEYCSERLADAFEVYTYGFSGSKPIWELRQADVLVLPYMSLSGQYINAPSLSHKIPAVSALDMLRYGGTLFGGGLNPEFLSYCAERSAKVYDFFDNEELTVKNAWLTAEGALEIILRKTESAIFETRVLILGWGRVARACAGILKCVGAKINIAARTSHARKDAFNMGFEAAPFIDKKALAGADVIINTVPDRVLEREHLELVKKDALIIDLASAPYGVDFRAAEELGLTALLAPGLPGKTAPKTAGRLIAEEIIRICGGGCVND